MNSVTVTVYVSYSERFTSFHVKKHSFEKQYFLFSCCNSFQVKVNVTKIMVWLHTAMRLPPLQFNYRWIKSSRLIFTPIECGFTPR